MTSDTKSPLFSFAIIADSHITDEEGLAIDGTHQTGQKVAGMYCDIIERVNAMAPEFVVHLGDITHPTPGDADYGDAAIAFHKASEVFTMPYYLVPGNHDIGEKLHPALPELDTDNTISKRNIGLYEQHFGRQRFSFKHQDCLFIVINSLLINSGLEEEEIQWGWLEQTLLDHDQGRVFVFSHYPLCLSDKDEHDHYDNIDEPGRARLIDLLEPFNVEGFYAGHVHNFFYNNINDMHQFVLPSTSIIRHDYLEYFQASPTREMGRFDPAKTGFFWIDVYADGHIPHLVRTKGENAHITHSWENNGPSVTMDLRMPWCDQADIATPWAVEIFERKLVRNDYPLSALWEMGIKEFRIPISDVMDERICKRVDELIGLGHKFTVVMFGMPDEARINALKSLGNGIKAIEVVGLLSQWQNMIQPLAELRKKSDYQIYLNPVRPEVTGWTTQHGLHTDLTDELDWVFKQPDLKQAVDGFVFGVRDDVDPCEGFQAVQDCLRSTDYKFILHVSCVGFDRTSAPTDDASRVHELTRAAEAAMLARANPGTSIVIDNFVELDRGYFNCRGLVDRFYNPKDGSRIISTLDNLLPRQLSNLATFETKQHRMISGDSDAGKMLLILSNNSASAPESVDQVPTQQGTLIDLVTGDETETTYQSLSEKSASGGNPLSAMLLILDQN